jgi:hypothetical protein
MPKYYSGVIEVEDNSFDLRADRFIPRKNEIALSFTGHDNLGKFKIDGIAKLTEHGFYIGPKLKLIYEDSNLAETLDTASIRIDHIKYDNLSSYLKFEGRWVQEDLNWLIKGSLPRNGAEPLSDDSSGVVLHYQVSDFRIRDTVRFVPHKRNAYYGFVKKKLQTQILVREVGLTGKQWLINPGMVTTRWGPWRKRPGDVVYKCGCQVASFSKNEHAACRKGKVIRCPQCKKKFKMVS